jgi:hypothetical protein
LWSAVINADRRGYSGPDCRLDSPTGMDCTPCTGRDNKDSSPHPPQWAQTKLPGIWVALEWARGLFQSVDALQWKCISPRRPRVPVTPNRAGRNGNARPSRQLPAAWGSKGVYTRSSRVRQFTMCCGMVLLPLNLIGPRPVLYHSSSLL